MTEVEQSYRPEVLARVVAVLAEQTRTASPITPATTIESDLGLFSMDVIRVLVRLEEDLGIELADEAMATARLVDVADLATLLTRSGRPGS